MKLKDDIEALITAPVTAAGFDVIELKLARYKNKYRLQVFVDSDNGIGLDDCARLSKTIESLIEDRALIDSDYILEVSSPGLDRPLQTEKDFRRRTGETVEVYFNDASLPAVRGELVGAEKRTIELLVDGTSQKYDLVGIKMGKIII